MSAARSQKLFMVLLQLAVDIDLPIDRCIICAGENIFGRYKNE